jgi:pilus assembly protein Flp/PilA
MLDIGLSAGLEMEYAEGMQQNRERGATAVEYGLFVAFIAAVIIISVASLGSSTIGLFQPVSDFFASLGH